MCLTKSSTSSSKLREHLPKPMLVQRLRNRHNTQNMQHMENMHNMQSRKNVHNMKVTERFRRCKICRTCRICKTKPSKPNRPSQTCQTKPTKPNLPDQTLQTEPNIPNQAKQNKPNKPNLANQTYQTKPTKMSNPKWICSYLFAVFVIIGFAMSSWLRSVCVMWKMFRSLRISCVISQIFVWVKAVNAWVLSAFRNVFVLVLPSQRCLWQ